MKKILVSLMIINSFSVIANDSCTYRVDGDVSNQTISKYESILKKHGFHYDPSSENSLHLSKGKQEETFLSNLNPITLVSDTFMNIGTGNCEPGRQCLPSVDSGTFVTPYYYTIRNFDRKIVGKIVRKYSVSVSGYSADQPELDGEELLIKKCESNSKK